jgi:hypothetical protein
VGGENGVVWFHYCRGHLWRWRYREGQLGFAAVVHGETLKEEGTKTGTGSATGSVENQESLETSTVIGEFADAIEN